MFVVTYEVKIDAPVEDFTKIIETKRNELQSMIEEAGEDPFHYTLTATMLNDGLFEMKAEKRGYVKVNIIPG